MSPTNVTTLCPGSATSATNTSTSVSGPEHSPVWSSGSGAIKEIRLHDAEVKVRVFLISSW